MSFQVILIDKLLHGEFAIVFDLPKYFYDFNNLINVFTIKKFFFDLLGEK